MFRWFAVSVFGACLAISAYYRYQARSQTGTIPRRREGGAALAARVLGGLFVLSTIAAHVISPNRMAWATFAAPLWIPWAGVASGLLAVALVYWVFSSIGGNVSETVFTKQEHTLVTVGPYRWVRHPLYATAVLLLGAIGLMLSSWLLLLIAALTSIIFRFVVVPVEEHQLTLRFGDEYRGYIRRTGSLLPKFTPGT